MSEQIDYSGAIALIRRVDDGTTSWLVRVSECGGRFRLIQTERLENESFREAISRELAWVLDLNRGKDFIVSSVPRLHLDFQHEIHTGEGIARRNMAIEFYVVDLFGSKSREQIANQSENQWLPGAELRKGLTPEGARLDDLQLLLLRKSDVIPEWNETHESH